jgi:hypothetical protein
MSDLDDAIRRGLERLTGPRSHAGPPTVEILAERRRQRRVRRAVATAAPTVVLMTLLGVAGTAVLRSGGDDRADVAISDEDAAGSGTTTSLVDTRQLSDDAEPGSHDLDEAEVDAARQVVSAFLDDVRAGDLEAAAERWTGHPELAPEAPVDERIPFIEELLTRLDFPRIVNQEGTEMFVTPSWGWTGADPVVTVLAPREGLNLPVAAAFTVDIPADDTDGPIGIRQLPRMDFPWSPDTGVTYTETTGVVEVTGLGPVEGGVRAFVNDTEVPVAIDLEAGTMTFTLPDGVGESDVAVTLSIASPEGSMAVALAYIVP